MAGLRHSTVTVPTRPIAVSDDCVKLSLHIRMQLSKYGSSTEGYRCDMGAQEERVTNGQRPP